MRILGLSAYYHDSAAALIEDGRIVFAAEEERFSRVKHDNAFPVRAIEACCAKKDILIRDIDAVAYYEKPLRKFERVLEMCAGTYPFSMRNFVTHMPEWLAKKITIEQQVRDLGFGGTMYFIPHHLSHAAFAFYPSPFDAAAILTVDGVGEYATTALWRGSGTAVEELASINFPHSLGLFYSTMTAFLGFRVNDDEYKVMGLAAYGKPTFKDSLSKLVSLRDDGSFSLEMDYFAFRESDRMWTRKMESLLGEPRTMGAEITARHRDLAASVQSITEDVYFGLLRELHRQTGETRVCIGGGVALNATANGKITTRTPFREAWVMGATGDSGAAAGAALYAHHGILGHTSRTPVNSLALGSSYVDGAIEEALSAHGVTGERFGSEAGLLDATCTLLEQGNVLAWFQGAMEFGPRALGNRSIIADPRSRDARKRVNDLKDRFAFQPFAGSILAEEVADYFDTPSSGSPFMTFCYPVHENKRDVIPAIVHEDGTCRIQAVTSENGRWYRLIKRFFDRTGVPCLLDTSFNGRGEPIVENPQQALAALKAMRLDGLVIGNFLVRS